jgi:hypothetical protein
MGDSCENVPQMLPFHRQLGDHAQAQDFLSPLEWTTSLWM